MAAVDLSMSREAAFYCLLPLLFEKAAPCWSLTVSLMSQIIM